LPEHFDILIVPAGQPQTKPRALNYGMAFARGTLITIYDAEDIPHARQLRLAAERFANEDPSLACLQAALVYYNPTENWLTRQFAAEYGALFKVMLPALAAHELPILLGGTSNHFRMECLRTVGGWDPFNVTEDADLGLRLVRAGLRCSVLPSSTAEEANTHLGNWLKQRRRWLKGFLQTWLVHMRHPLNLHRDIGLQGFWTLQCLTLGVFASALLHPLLLVYSLIRFLPEHLIVTTSTTAGQLLSGLSLAVLVGGYGVSMGLAAVGLASVGMASRLPTVLTVPLYWMLQSVAAWAALWDFAIRPFHWHKTRHGLSRRFRNGQAPGATAT
jgi:cellulose synthase/poly-beta-1,6-N-acetylglucosamine synthase-like glycosyltransferase